MVVILHNIRSLYNIGSIFRTADAVGVSKVYLTGYTPAPLDRFGRARADFHKSALGAEDNVKWESVGEIMKLIEILRKQDYEIVGLEQDPRAQDYKAYRPEADQPWAGKFALVLGNEVGGVEKSVLDLCDMIIEIPMKGSKESLNVSVAFGIALYEAKK